MKFSFNIFIKLIPIVSLCTIILIYFNNCDVYSDNQLFTEVQKSCVDYNDCVNYNYEYLELKINTENNFALGLAETSFDIGGECNEAGFYQNAIIWEIYLSDQMILNSQVQKLNTSCIQGRFSMRVILPRPGLADSSGVRREHRLDVELIGIDKEGNLYKNSLLARKSITLTPK